jgi:hypothetical protein
MAGDIHGLTGINVSALTTGQSVSPPITFGSEVSLGLFRSAASTIQQSYGSFVVSTLSVAGTARLGGITSTSGLSVGSASNGGTNIPAISSTSSLVAPFVVQGSASSFTIIAWAAAKAYDIILVTPGTTATVSSISSGLVPHSHCTQDGQIEFRLSNVSTLAQNQSTRTWYFTRITPF